jgi:DNA-binding MarR family transcriptional regulator
MTNTGVGRLDRLIHEPARLVMMANLYVVDEADFLYLERQTGLTAGNISSHMTKLEDAGYVDVRKEFVGKRPRTIYRLTDAGRRAFDDHRQRLASLLQT